MHARGAGYGHAVPIPHQRWSATRRSPSLDRRPPPPRVRFHPARRAHLLGQQGQLDDVEVLVQLVVLVQVLLLHAYPGFQQPRHAGCMGGPTGVGVGRRPLRLRGSGMRGRRRPRLTERRAVIPCRQERVVTEAITPHFPRNPGVRQPRAEALHLPPWSLLGRPPAGLLTPPHIAPPTHTPTHTQAQTHFRRQR